MKYILEVLGSSSAPFEARNNAVSALDNYDYHRPGQPIAAVYRNSKGEKRALLAIGHAYGKGRDGNTVRYTIIGDADGSNSITSYNWASQIRLNRIDYSRLLDDYFENVTPGHRRFGYLGTDYDSWHTNPANASDRDCVPNGATVQEAFEHILKGNFGQDTETSLRLVVVVAPRTVELPNAGESDASYTVTVQAYYTGTLDNARLDATYGTGGDANLIPGLSGPDHEWQKTFTVGSNFDMQGANAFPITYTAYANLVGGSEETSYDTVTIVKQDIPGPEPTATYTVIYQPREVTGSPVTDTKQGDSWTVWTLETQSPWPSPSGYTFGGWTFNSDGTGDTVSSLTVTDFPAQEPYTLTVYPKWNQVVPTRKTLSIVAAEQSYTYDGQDHVYNYRLIKIYADNTDVTSEVTWNSDGTAGTAAGFTVAFTPAELPSQKDTGSSSAAVQVTPTDMTEYTDASASATATVRVNPALASISTKLNGQSSVTLATGSQEPQATAQFSGFVQDDLSVLNTLYNSPAIWKNWQPSLDMTLARTYTLEFDYSSVSGPGAGNINFSNYTLQTNWATLTVQEPPLEVRFTTTGYTNELAVHQSDLRNTQFIHNTATSNGLTGNVNDWWIFVSDRRSPSQYTTYIYSNKNIGNFSIMRWDSASNIWRDMSSQLSKFTVDSSTRTITFKYYNEDDECWEVETSLYAIKFN